MQSHSANGAAIGPVETILWILLGSLVIGGYLAVSNGPDMGNDSYQYLSVADNILHGRGIQTSVVHFDVERSWGRVPAPMTTFPSGYPLMIAAVSLFGLPLERAALLVSAGSLLVLLLLYRVLASRLSLTRTSWRLLFIWTIANSWTAIYSTALVSEALFSAASLAAIACLLIAMTDGHPSSRHLRLLIAANLFVGLAYWIRYAGLFLFTALVLFCAWQLWVRRDRAFRTAFAATVVSAAIIGAGLARNYWLVGTWKGGNDKEVLHPVVDTAVRFVKAVYHLIFGGVAPARFGAAEFLVLAGAGLLLAAWLVLGWRTDAAPSPPPSKEPQRFLLLYMAVYCGAMFYLGVTSVISFGPRMFYPLLPPSLLLGAVWLAHLERRAHGRQTARLLVLSAVAILTAGYVAINTRSLIQTPDPPPHALVQRYLSEPTAGDPSLAAWIDSHIPSDATIMANEGQATAFLLRRKTVSLVSMSFSKLRWTEDSVRANMHQYGVNYLIIYSGNDRERRDLSQSDFLSNLAKGRPPAWLTVATRNHHTIIYQTNRPV